MGIRFISSYVSNEKIAIVVKSSWNSPGCFETRSVGQVLSTFSPSVKILVLTFFENGNLSLGFMIPRIQPTIQPWYSFRTQTLTSKYILQENLTLTPWLRIEWVTHKYNHLKGSGHAIIPLNIINFRLFSKLDPSS